VPTLEQRDAFFKHFDSRSRTPCELNREAINLQTEPVPLTERSVAAQKKVTGAQEEHRINLDGPKPMTPSQFQEVLETAYGASTPFVTRPVLINKAKQ